MRTSSTLVSALLHAAAIALVLAATGGPNAPIAAAFRPMLIVPPDPGAYLPPARRNTLGGGGGGTRSEMPPSKGRLPRRALRQFTPPVAAMVNPAPLLAMEPAIVAPADAVLPVVNMAQLGDPDGAAGPLSSGRGSGGGIGDGLGGGVGIGSGAGFGPGIGGGVTNGAWPSRGSLHPAVLLRKIEPDYTEEARKARVSGIVVLYIEVDERGLPRNVAVRRSLGLGLDERAIDAVLRWRFRPGTRDGRPVATSALVEVRFRLL